MRLNKRAVHFNLTILNSLVMMNHLITFARLFPVLVFCLAISLMTSCEKESFAPAPTSNLVEYSDLAEAEYAPKDKAYIQAPAFTFEIQKNYCTLEGVNLNVIIDRPENYTFKWAIDGNHGGHNSYTPGCVCGNTATVFITRLSDGMSLRQAIDLPACGPDFE